MEYFGIFLILVAAGLRLVGGHYTGPRRQPRITASFAGVCVVPPGPAAFLLAAAGIFIFAASIGSR